jgi:S-adenosylmethionine:tRNA ribosyltransferase-isomerase
MENVDKIKRGEPVQIPTRSSRREWRPTPVRSGAEPELQDKSVRDLPDLLAPGDALVINDTRVIPARLEGQRLRDGSPRSISRRRSSSAWVPNVGARW